MSRNLSGRMEVLAPIRDPGLRPRVDEMLDVLAQDDTLAWELAGDGTWRRPEDGGTINPQTHLEEAALAFVRPIAAV
jgi:polyphosphate kinase